MRWTIESVAVLRVKFWHVGPTILQGRTPLCLFVMKPCIGVASVGATGSDAGY
jgi:hypothetical protein